MPKDLIDHFMTYGQRLTVEKDEIIFTEGGAGRGTSAYFLESGMVALATITKEGEERVYLYFNGKRLIGFAQILKSMDKAEGAGFERLRKIGHAEIFLIAKTDCVLYQLREPDFRSLLKSDLQFARLVIQVLSANYIDLLDHFQQTLEESAGTRFCRLLLESHVEKDGMKVLPRSMTFLEMSKYLGTHPVTVSRIVAALKKDGCITKEQGLVVILDEERLLELIRSGEEIK